MKEKVEQLINEAITGLEANEINELYVKANQYVDANIINSNNKIDDIYASLRGKALIHSDMNGNVEGVSVDTYLKDSLYRYSGKCRMRKI